MLFEQSQSLTVQINQSIQDTREIEKRLTAVEDTVGKLVAIAPPIPEPPLTTPEPDILPPPPLPDPPAVETADLDEIKQQLAALLAKVDAIKQPTFDVVIEGKDHVELSRQTWAEITKRGEIRIPPLSFKSADTGQIVTGGLGQTFPFVLVPNQGQSEAE